MYPWLDDAIERDAVVITGNRRLARELRAAFAAKRIRAGVESWITPAIHSWNGWCRRQIDAAAGPDPSPVVLDDHCAAILWERCLRKHAPDSLPSFRGFLRQARDAWQLVRDWKVPVSALAKSALSADERLFASAATDYQGLLESRSWTDSGDMPRIVAGLLTDECLGAPTEAFFAGFDRLWPAVADTIDALKAAGCTVHAPLETDASTAVRVAAFEDHDAELRAAGAWARELLFHEPDARIAIVDPELSGDAGREARLVREGLAPGWQYAPAAYRSAVDVSYGRRLKDYPAIAIALLLTKWLWRGLSTKEVSLLLRSKCLLDENSAGRSRMELALRKLPDRAWQATDLKQVLRGVDASQDALAWLHGLDAVIALRDEGRREASLAYWASRIDGLLEVWRWPGSATLESGEFQLVNRWRELLNDLARTALVLPSAGLGDAAERLATLAEDVVFQPEVETGLVSLMGTLEAAGLQFDHLWICGMHAGLWPPTANPSPLMSRELQKEYGLPDARPGDTLQFSRRVFHRLLDSAPAVVLSWPKSDGESELAASGFLDAIAHDCYDGPGDPGWHATKFCGIDDNLTIAEDAVPAVDDDEIVRGGAYTVQRQYVEPFAAFVYGRLGVRRAEAIEAGIAPRVRGEIIHNALHTLFAGRPTQADIRSWDESELRRRLGAAIDAALAGPLRHADETYARLLALERRRLFWLLRSFVGEEIERPEFTVADVEKDVDFEKFGVRLKLRIDRVDRLADGSMLVIDYKTGAPRNLLNRDGDPTDLQLVVYADALQDRVGGIAIINVDSRSISYKGTGGSVEWDAKNRDAWPERLAAWRDEVHEAIREIAAGDVRVNVLFNAAEGRPLGILSRLEELKRAH